MTTLRHLSKHQVTQDNKRLQAKRQMEPLVTTEETPGYETGKSQLVVQFHNSYMMMMMMMMTDEEEVEKERK